MPHDLAPNTVLLSLRRGTEDAVHFGELQGANAVICEGDSAEIDLQGLPGIQTQLLIRNASPTARIGIWIVEAPEAGPLWLAPGFSAFMRMEGKKPIAICWRTPTAEPGDPPTDPSLN